MDQMLLRVYQEQVAYSCRAVLLGAEDINSSMQSLSRREQPGPRLWYGVQNVIVGAGNVSKALWGAGSSGARSRRYVERQELRDSLEVTDTSPLRTVEIRNDYEHLDERIEQWWNSSTHRNHFQLLIGPRDAIGGEAFDERDTLRWLDPVTFDVIFWGNSLNIQEVTTDVARLLPIAELEMSRP